MTYLRSFKDTEASCYATVGMNYGSNGTVGLEDGVLNLMGYRYICQISVEPRGVIVKIFEVGIVGVKEHGSKAVYDANKIGKTLHQLFPNDLTSQEMSNPALKIFTNAILHCSNLVELTEVLKEISENVESKSMNGSLLPKAKSYGERTIMKYCCGDMKGQIEFKCPDHPDLSDCPDSLVAFWKMYQDFGLRVHGGGTSVVGIDFCPWCGASLSGFYQRKG